MVTDLIPTAHRHVTHYTQDTQTLDHRHTWFTDTLLTNCINTQHMLVALTLVHTTLYTWDSALVLTDSAHDDHIVMITDSLYYDDNWQCALWW